MVYKEYPIPYTVIQKAIVMATGGNNKNMRNRLFFSIFASSNVYTIPNANNILSRNTIPTMNEVIILLCFTGFLNGFGFLHYTGRIICYY